MPAPTMVAAPRTWADDARLAAPLLAGLGLALWSPSDDGVTICPTRVCTGAACPGCGLTRGLAALAKGDLAQSWYYHPFAVAFAVQVAMLWGLAVGNRVGVVAWRPSSRWVPALLIVNAVALLAIWIVRWRLGLLERVL